MAIVKSKVSGRTGNYPDTKGKKSPVYTDATPGSLRCPTIPSGRVIEIAEEPNHSHSGVNTASTAHLVSPIPVVNTDDGNASHVLSSKSASIPVIPKGTFRMASVGEEFASDVTRTTISSDFNSSSSMDEKSTGCDSSNEVEFEFSVQTMEGESRGLMRQPSASSNNSTRGTTYMPNSAKSSWHNGANVTTSLASSADNAFNEDFAMKSPRTISQKIQSGRFTLTSLLPTEFADSVTGNNTLPKYTSNSTSSPIFVESSAPLNGRIRSDSMGARTHDIPILDSEYSSSNISGKSYPNVSSHTPMTSALSDGDYSQQLQANNMTVVKTTKPTLKVADGNYRLKHQANNLTSVKTTKTPMKEASDITTTDRGSDSHSPLRRMRAHTSTASTEGIQRPPDHTQFVQSLSNLPVHQEYWTKSSTHNTVSRNPKSCPNSNHNSPRPYTLEPHTEEVVRTKSESFRGKHTFGHNSVTDVNRLLMNMMAMMTDMKAQISQHQTDVNARIDALQDVCKQQEIVLQRLLKQQRKEPYDDECNSKMLDTISSQGYDIECLKAENARLRAAKCV
eukprot:CFRG6003T1